MMLVMEHAHNQPALISQVSNVKLTLAGRWTAQYVANVETQLESIGLSLNKQSANSAALNDAPANNLVIADCKQIQALDTAGALLLLMLINGYHKQKVQLDLIDLQANFKSLLDFLANKLTDDLHTTQDNKTLSNKNANVKKPNVQNPAIQNPAIQNPAIQNQEIKIKFDQASISIALPSVAPAKLEQSIIERSIFERFGYEALNMIAQLLATFHFIGETFASLLGSVIHPKRIRWRPILFNIRSAGLDALPIVGLMSFLLGIVVAYQGAGQLRQYGANIFVADLVGLSMLREFAPLITAIIVAGRSGSAYAAQIGTMVVTEEIDAMRTIGISPQEMLVLPKLVALIMALPLLTVFADVMGVFGGMLMARSQLDVEFVEFLDRFVKAVSPTAFMLGIGKAPLFAAIIVMIGCYQGFKTKGGADSVGRQTTRSVVQSIFLVIVADALFSIVFSMLNI